MPTLVFANTFAIAATTDADGVAENLHNGDITSLAIVNGSLDDVNRGVETIGYQDVQARSMYTAQEVGCTANFDFHSEIFLVGALLPSAMPSTSVYWRDIPGVASSFYLEEDRTCVLFTFTVTQSHFSGSGTWVQLYVDGTLVNGCRRQFPGATESTEEEHAMNVYSGHFLVTSGDTLLKGWHTVELKFTGSSVDRIVRFYCRSMRVVALR